MSERDNIDDFAFLGNEALHKYILINIIQFNRQTLNIFASLMNIYNMCRPYNQILLTPLPSDYFTSPLVFPTSQLYESMN